MGVILPRFCPAYSDYQCGLVYMLFFYMCVLKLRIQGSHIVAVLRAALHCGAFGALHTLRPGCSHNPDSLGFNIGLQTCRLLKFTILLPF